MDKELEQNVKDLERGYELKQEEAMHGERVGQTLEMNEELEDKLELVKKLRKQLKFTRGTSIGVFTVLILVLLYACVTYIMHPSQTVTEKTITYNLEVPEQAEEPEHIVHNETLTFVMEVPEIDMSQVKSITLDELMGTLSTRKDKVVYLDETYKQGDEYPSGVILYSAETVEKAFASAKRIYTLNGEIMECSHHPQGILPGCFVRRYLDADISSSSSYVYYYNDAVLRENTLFESWEVSDVPNHYGHKEWGIKLEIYGKTDVDVSSLIKNTLESLPFARFLPTSDGYAANDMADHYRFGVDPERVAKSIINGLSDVEFSLEIESPSQEYEDYFYSTDGIEYTEAVTNYNIKVVDYDYKSWICGVQEHWFE